MLHLNRIICNGATGGRADEAVAGGLHPQGGYWYLDTRPDELQAMPRHGWEGRLYLAARAIDERLKVQWQNWPLPSLLPTTMRYNG